jgi:hypothetical protein
MRQNDPAAHRTHYLSITRPSLFVYNSIQAATTYLYKAPVLLFLIGAHDSCTVFTV